MPLIISNSIQLGLLRLEFIGWGELKGKQPLLSFFFERMEIKIGQQLLFSRSLDAPEEKKRPFFALVGIAASGEWLSARGRGGGLAIWLKASEISQGI